MHPAVNMLTSIDTSNSVPAEDNEPTVISGSTLQDLFEVDDASSIRQPTMFLPEPLKLPAVMKGASTCSMYWCTAILSSS